MKKLLALINARNLEFVRDRSALTWTLLFPFIVLLGFAYGYSGKAEPLLIIRASGRSAAENPVIRLLKETPGMDLQVLPDEAAALKKLSRYEADLAIQISDDGSRLSYATNSDSQRGKLAENLFRQAVVAQPEPRPQTEIRAVTGRRIRYADWLLPGLLAMNIMFGSMFGVGYVIVRYRKNGVLKRLRATPLSAFQFLLSQVVSRMLLMVVTSFIVVAGAMLFIGFKPASLGTSTIDLLLFLSVSSAAMISVGLVVAAQISSEEVADGVLNLMTWPMIFLSGIWFSLDGATPWVLWISKLMPLSYVVKGLRAILIDGARFTDLMPEVGILLVITAVLVTIGSALFKWR